MLLLIMLTFTGFNYIVMTILIFAVMSVPLWVFNVPISIVFVKITTRIEHSLKRESGYDGCSVVACSVCFVILKMTTTGGPAIVGGQGEYFCRFRNKLRYQWTTSDKTFSHGIISVVSSTYFYALIPHSSQHTIFHPVNIKLQWVFHHCRACFSFSGSLHASGQIWP